MKTHPTPTRGARFSALAFAVLTLASPLTAAVPARDEATIRAASKSYRDLGLARDWPNWGKTFTEDAVFMPPHEAAVNGRQAIEKWANSFPTMRELTIEPVEFTGNGDLAVVRGRYSFTVGGANEPSVSDSGKYIEIWRKQSDGTWKLVRDIFNSDLPLPTPTPVPAQRPR